MNQQEIRKILAGIGALVEDSHIVYETWQHGSTDIKKKMIYFFPEEAYHLCDAVAKRFADDNVEVVIGPETGGLVLSRWTAYHLTNLHTGVKKKMVPSVCAVRWQGKRKTFVIQRSDGKNIFQKNVLVVDDILTTGSTVMNVVDAVTAIGGKVVGIGVFCNRGGVTPKDVAGVPKLVSLLDITREKWTEKECPKCKQGIPVNTSVGKGLEFISRKQIQAS